MNRSLLIRIVWAACLAGGTATHALALIGHGWRWDYGGVPWWVAGFWTSLTFIDPSAAAFLFVKPRIGAFATVAIMAVDVAVNVWVVATYGGVVWMVASQIAFLIFVLATAKLALRYR